MIGVGSIDSLPEVINQNPRVEEWVSLREAAKIHAVHSYARRRPPPEDLPAL